VERWLQVFEGKHESKSHLEDLEVDGWTILKWILKNWDLAHGLDSSE
jgi:hypothetical protein